MIYHPAKGEEPVEGDTPPGPHTQADAYRVVNSQHELNVAVVATYGMTVGEGAFPNTWAEAIHPYLQRPRVYRTAADLALRMATQSGAYVAVDPAAQFRALAFGLCDPAENTPDVTNFRELGVVWPKREGTEALPEYVLGIGGIVHRALGRVDEEDTEHKVVVRYYSGDSREEGFFAQNFGMTRVPIVSRPRLTLLVATAGKIREKLEDPFGIKEYY